jgi:hypothetical protein
MPVELTEKLGGLLPGGMYPANQNTAGKTGSETCVNQTRLKTQEIKVVKETCRSDFEI